MSEGYIDVLEVVYKENFLDAYKKAHFLAQNVFGLRLSVIEKVLLRHYVRDACESLEGTQKMRNMYRPSEEGLARFFIMEYDLPYSCGIAKHVWTHASTESMRVYLMRKQFEKKYGVRD
jgi:hypothetical protein